MKFDLTKPIKIAGEEIVSIELAEERLTTRLIKQLGFPFNFGPDLMPVPRSNVCAEYISRLAAISPSEVEKLSPQDFMAMSFALVGFFVERGASTPQG